MALGMDLEEDLWNHDANRTARRRQGAVQGEHEVVAGSQCVRQDGPGRTGLAGRGCHHDQGLAPARLQAATRRHPPAACVLPDLRPTMPSWSTSTLIVERRCVVTSRCRSTSLP
jgi:hypothetical protein